MATTNIPAAVNLAGKPEIEVNVAEIPSSPSAELPHLAMLPHIPRGRPGADRPITALPHFPRHPSPTGSTRSSFSRRVVRHRHGFKSGFSRSHRSEVSKELSRQAETEFVSLIELIAGISARSSSLKSVWSKIISERESWSEEMDRMYEQFEEMTEVIEQHEKHKHEHQHGHEERKQELIKIRLELSAALNSVAEYKRKIGDRDHTISELRRKISESEDIHKHLVETHEETKSELEEKRVLLIASNEARDAAEEDARKHEHDLRTLRHEYTELKTSHTEMSSKYESTHHELTSVTSILVQLKKEKHEWSHEKSELEERYRKCEHRNTELKRKVKEVTEHYEKRIHEITETVEKKKREVHELNETLTKIKHEREELHTKVKTLEREIEEEHGKWEEADHACSKWKLKYEHSEREIVQVREEIRIIEVKQTELREKYEKSKEEYKKVVIEKERLEEEHHGACKKRDENHRQILVLQETVHQLKTTITEKSELIHTLHERIERITSECEEWRGKCADHEAKHTEYLQIIAKIEAEIKIAIADRDSYCERLRECEQRYEEVYESITEHQENNSSYEYEITHFRSMLQEARDERDRALTARAASDRERDDANSRYETKCREMQKLEEKWAQHLHGHGHGRGGRSSSTTRRYFSSSSSAIHEDDESHAG